jgi:hypothetical protein
VSETRASPFEAGANVEITALLHSDYNDGRGSYNSFDRWSVALRSSSGSVGSRLVTVHEAVHATLNDVTAYGVLLAVHVAMGRSAGHLADRDQRFMLGKLVDACRDTHEAFATFESLWIVAAADSRWLEGYPRYRGWFKDAHDARS